MELPKSLSPWSSYLTLLAAPLPWSLGPTIKCLDLVLGPSRIALSEESADEPEGYDGIARKGTYERLVLSEWLLADEYPEEFLRRSTVGEHAFLELTRRSPSGKKVTTVLFDCGPNQLGTPRVAHLAVLIVLARRAEINGMEVEWGVLQDGSGALVQGASKESIEKLLSSRTVQEVTDRDIDRWFESVKDRNVVIMGGARLSRMMRKRKATLLTIEDVLEPGEHALSASYSASTGSRKSQFNLPLPVEHDCVRLLQNPFEDTSKDEKQKKEKQPATDWSLTASGEFFLLRQSANCVMSLRVPPTARSRGLRQRMYSIKGGTELIASGANLSRSTLAVLTCSPGEGKQSQSHVINKDDVEKNPKGTLYAEDEFNLFLIGGAGLSANFKNQFYPRIKSKEFPKGYSRNMTSIFPSPRNSLNDVLWVHLGSKIIEIPARIDSSSVRLIADGVLWLTRSRGHLNGLNQDVLVYAKENNNRFHVVIVGLDTNDQEIVSIPGWPLFCSPSEILIAFRDERLGFYSFATHPASVSVSDSIQDRQLLHGEVPIAMIKAGHFGTSMTGLLTISADKRDLHVVSSGDQVRMRLPQATSTIHSVAVNQSGVVAYVTDRVLTVVWPDGEWQPFIFDGHRFNSQWEE